MIQAGIPSDDEIRAATKRRLVREDRTCLSYWFPKIEAAGLPVPKTRIVSFTDYDTHHELGKFFDGGSPGSAGVLFLDSLSRAVNEIGCPCFLRTGQTSNKHNWKNTCYLESPDDLIQHVYNLMEFSECADMFGLTWNVWVVRELLPTKPVCTLPQYDDMPLCREFRCFVDGGEILCVHPYWTRASVEQGFPRRKDGPVDDVWGLPAEHELPDNFDDMYDRVRILGENEREKVIQIATQAGAAVGGRWSVDILDTHRGWILTDMAEMDKSFHWPGCENAPADDIVKYIAAHEKALVSLRKQLPISCARDGHIWDDPVGKLVTICTREGCWEEADPECTPRFGSLGGRWAIEPEHEDVYQRTCVRCGRVEKKRPIQLGVKSPWSQNQ